MLSEIDLIAANLKFNGATLLGAGSLTLRGTSDAVANLSYTSFTNLSGTQLGYVGDGSASHNDIGLVSFAGGLRFLSNNLERMAITAAGVVSVYGDTPGTSQVSMGLRGSSGSLQAIGTTNSCLFMNGANENVYLRAGVVTGSIYVGDTGTAVVQIGAAAIPVTLSGSTTVFNDDVRSNRYFGRTDTGKWLAINASGSLHTFGTVMVRGQASGFAGVTIDDGGTRYPTFMASASLFGVHVTTGTPYWSWNEDGTTFKIGKACEAPSFNATSSRDIKQETGHLNSPREILAKLRPILYRFLEGDKHEQIGLIAEEVAEVCPQLSRDGKTVAYDRLALLLLADWQERYA